MYSWVRSLLLITTVAGFALPPHTADAALNGYLKIKGQKQGVIEGGATAKGREKWIPVVAIEHVVTSPRDPSTGIATGKRVHEPVVFTKEVDRSTPLLYRALVTGETLPEVELVVFAAGDKGAKTPLYSLKLINASITEIQFVTPKDGPEVHEISMAYQKIIWTWLDGAITSEDTWGSPVSKPQPAPTPMPMPKN